ncbi:sodium/proline symporter PutP [Propioniferax innocua]|uniref:Sodium/proline symporter n=1 Tax=Propioniferax innocua TaxID=1753 RepID=A0A542ZBK4_9ACTN|nr:sodium/proline symporter PutP [Propioniferax innocua]TQL57718.1 sodium/proline symporter [Propioniferax innocua]
MSPDTVVKIIAMLLYFAGMIAVGVWATKRTRTMQDYMLGGRNLPPAVAALSAGASDMSGWLLMGLPGAIYMGGLVQAWIAIGLTLGAWVNWKIVAPRLRIYTEVSGNAITIPSFLDNRFATGGRALRVIAGLVILVFFTFYVSSGFVAGGQFTVSAFGDVLSSLGLSDDGSRYMAGMLVVAGVTIAYTLVGGFLGASYTDFFQGVLMFLALLLVPIVALFIAGGPGEVVSNVNEAQPGSFNLFDMEAGGGFITVLGLFAWGLGYFGQPHIIVRFMALRDMRDAVTGRRIGIGWMALCVAGAIGSAIVGIGYIGQRDALTVTDTENGETVFLDMAQQLFPSVIAGLVLAAVLAAIMSTISSQLVVSSSALVEDLTKMVLGDDLKMSPRRQVWLGRAGVGLVAVIAIALAWNPDSSILDLVGFAWAGFGASFGSVVVLSLFWRRFTGPGAIAAMIGGALTVALWKIFGLDAVVYELLPGFAVSLILGLVVSKAKPEEQPKIDAEFDKMLELLHSEVKQTDATQA